MVFFKSIQINSKTKFTKYSDDIASWYTFVL